jgi:hypothetical protein
LKPDAKADPDTFPEAYDRPRLLAIDEARDAAAAYRRAKARYLEAERMQEASPARRELDADPGNERAKAEVLEWDRWARHLMLAETVAENRLALTVMAMCGREVLHPHVERLEPGWRPCALELDDTMYVVLPRDEDDWRPRVVAVDAGKDFDSGQYEV